ncbi:hypothetical protein PoB_001227800 [Plakobranchus ocellatus]|uniref:Uncharacterized protein n=1 Tax=Plakobranchus ocellatus TaxID=259542 RepID=A0AAV3YTB1_9GAST|nr:hypothetical protein PoB_001227800 [Plakobranchus ocellatus]
MPDKVMLPPAACLRSPPLPRFSLTHALTFYTTGRDALSACQGHVPSLLQTWTTMVLNLIWFKVSILWQTLTTMFLHLILSSGFKSVADMDARNSPSNPDFLFQVCGRHGRP